MLIRHFMIACLHIRCRILAARSQCKSIHDKLRFIGRAFRNFGYQITSVRIFIWTVDDNPTNRRVSRADRKIYAHSEEYTHKANTAMACKISDPLRWPCFIRGTPAGKDRRSSKKVETVYVASFRSHRSRRRPGKERRRTDKPIAQWTGTIDAQL